jgi:hypothetical protein
MTRSQIALLCLLAGLSFAGSFTNTLGFDRYAFGDKGWPLTVDVMLEEGQVPVRDFGYFYGLLTLLFDRALFAAFGRTPQALAAVDGVCAALVTLGIVRTALAAKLDRVSGGFLAVCAPFMVMPIFYASPAHGIEAALLANALAFQVSGRLGWALLLVTTAVFFKPSLGYFYGLLLLLLVLGGWPAGKRRWLRLAPATVAGVGILATLVAVFGWDPVVRTQLPFGAMRAYKDSGFGFLFGSGRQLWLPEPFTPLYYVFSVAGIWLTTSAFLLVAAARLLPRFREPLANLTVTCAGLHLVFVLVLFGNQWSWIYYPYILFVGAAVGLTAWRRIGTAGAARAAEEEAEESPAARRLRGVGVALAVVALLGQVWAVWIEYAFLPATVTRSPVTAGLYYPPGKTAQWGAARELARTQRVFVLTKMGCPQLLAPEMDGPRTWCLIQATATPAELDRVRRGIAAADWLLVPIWHDVDLYSWPEFAEDVKPFRKMRLDWPEFAGVLKPIRDAFEREDTIAFVLYKRATPAAVEAAPKAP